MPFLDDIDLPCQKGKLGQIKPPILIGILALAIALLVFAGVKACSYASGDSLRVFTQDENESSVQNDASSQDSDSRGQGGNSSDSASEDSASASSSRIEVVVYVCGCVAEPGVYALPSGKRVLDAIEAAGGFTDDAAQEALNLARLIQEGEQIRVPSKDETAGSASYSGAVSFEGASSSSQGNGLVSINTASSSELTSLPGIGEATAAKIVASRESDGPFETLEDLKRVSGIGDKKFEAVKDLICL